MIDQEQDPLNEIKHPTVGQRIESIAKELGADAHKLVDEFEHWLEGETEGAYKATVPSPKKAQEAAIKEATQSEVDSGSAMQSTVEEGQKPDPNSSAQTDASAGSEASAAQ